MKTIKININRELIFKKLLFESKALITSSFKIGGNYLYYFTTLLPKFLSICLFSLVMLSACTKEEDLMPTSVNTIDSVNLKAMTPTHYVAINGNDAANGDITHPWKTLTYACANATESGNIISIAAGSYTVNNLCSLSPGVSLLGAGKTQTIIQCTNTIDKTINMASATLTAGNQSISGIGFDGVNLTGYSAIVINKRYNVSVHDCDFKNFNFRSISFYNGSGYNNIRPAVYAQGNEFYNNTITNGGATWATSGSSIYLTGQIGFKLYGNTVASTKRGDSPPGIIIKASELKALDMHNNTFTIVGNDDEAKWAFAFEVWDIADGSKIYDNTIQGVLDLVNIYKGNSTFGVSVYGNTFGFDAIQSVSKHGIYLEGNFADVEIKTNTFKHLSTPIALYTLSTGSYSNIRIHHNTFNKIGFTGSTYNTCIDVAGTGGYTLNGYYIDNNTFVSGANGANTFVGITIPAKGTTSNVYIRNNIIKDFDRVIVSQYAPTGGMTIANVFIQNNDLYSNGYGDAPNWIQIVPTSVTSTGNITTDPLFVSISDFHLQPSSPAINTGLDVGLPYNGSAPDIGAFEYSTGRGRHLLP